MNKEKWKALIYQYRHGFLFLYILIYMPWFSFLEGHVVKHFHIVHMVLDDYIPFVEYFVVPYIFWFVYVSVTAVFFFFYNREDFVTFMKFIITGMTIFLIISTIYPNGAYLRPIVFPRDNIFTDLVKIIYSSDTQTNLFPSIHVYNAIGTHLAISHSKAFKDKHILVRCSEIAMILIVLSTMFIKQHSVFDVLTGIGLSFFMYLLLYTPEFVKSREQSVFSFASKYKF